MKAIPVIAAGLVALAGIGAFSLVDHSDRTGETSKATALPAPVAPPPTYADNVAALKTEWMDGNDLCRGSSNQADIRHGCRARGIADRKLKKLGICFAYSDWRVPEPQYDWHPCSVSAPADFVPPPEYVPPAPPPPSLTLAKFEALRPGMSRKMVADTIGFDGDEQSSTYISGEMKTVIWHDPQGIGGMSITFENGMLMSKTQFGLR
jgi:hypothetical protein